MKIKKMISFILGLLLSTTAGADFWIERASIQSNGYAEVTFGWLFDEDYEGYEVRYQYKEDWVGINGGGSTSTVRSELRHFSGNTNDREYHSARYDWTRFVDRYVHKHTVSVKGISNNGSKKETLTTMDMTGFDFNRTGKPGEFMDYTDALTRGGHSASGIWLAGDFRGIGRDDLMFVFNDTGSVSMDLYPSLWSRFSGQVRWITRNGGITLGRWFVADFNGDGRDDVGHVWNNNGTATIQYYKSTGYGLERLNWIRANAGPYNHDDRWLAGDFNGDGIGDVIRVEGKSNNATDFHLFRGTGGSLAYAGLMGSNQGGFWTSQRWFAGDFDNNGYTDLAKIWNDHGAMSADVHLSDGTSLTMHRWATRQGGYWDSQDWVVGDFDGDWKDDLAKAFWGDMGSTMIDAHLSRGNRFEMQRAASYRGHYKDGHIFIGGNFGGGVDDQIAKIFTLKNYYSIDLYSKQ